MKILIAGEHPFASEIGGLCDRAGHETLVYLIEDFYDAIESGFVMEQLPTVDVAIEIHNESAAAKQELLLSMAYGLGDDTLLLTSAFVVSTAEAAAWVPFPDRVVGFGLLPPLEKGNIVEIASGINTDQALVKRARQFWESLGLKTLLVQDCAGLVGGRFVGSLINEAVNGVLAGLASPPDLDAALQQGANMLIGPLSLADYLGLDAVLGIMDGLYAETRDPRYRPSPLLRRMVAAGKHGRKSGEGFFIYGEETEHNSG